MRVLLDRCMGSSTRVALGTAGHDVVWVGDWPEDPGDPSILETAFDERRVLITIDKDFGGLAILHGLPHAGIVRLAGIPARQQASVCLHVLEEQAADLEAGAIVTVHLGRVRVRRPETPNDQEDT